MKNKIQTLAPQYGIQDDAEVQRLCSIFLNEEVQRIISHAEIWRKIKFSIYFISIFIISYILISASYNGSIEITYIENGVHYSQPSTLYYGLFLSISAIALFTILLFISFRTRTEKEFKKIILNQLFQILHPNVKYSNSNTYSFSVQGLKDMKLLSSYDRIESREDSVEFTIKQDEKSIHIQGMELTTSSFVGKIRVVKKLQIIVILFMGNILKQTFLYKLQFL